jgi:pimeloyl-ACP methyl ester carboxylesterase
MVRRWSCCTAFCSIRALADSDTRDDLAEVRAPTLLVWGDADRRSPLNVARDLENRMPAARLVVIPGAGHLSNVEAPARFNAEVREFCLHRI